MNVSQLRNHLVEKHEFRRDDPGLVGDADDLDAFHQDVHDDEDAFQNHDRGVVEP